MKRSPRSSLPGCSGSTHNYESKGKRLTFSPTSHNCIKVSKAALAISVSYGASCCSTATSEGKA